MLGGCCSPAGFRNSSLPRRRNESGASNNSLGRAFSAVWTIETTADLVLVLFFNIFLLVLKKKNGGKQWLVW